MRTHQRPPPKPVTRKIPPSYVISAPIPITVADAALNALPLPSSTTSDLASSVVPAAAKFTSEISHALQGPMSSLAKLTLTRWNDEAEKSSKAEALLIEHSATHKRIEDNPQDRHAHVRPGATNQLSAPDDRNEGRRPMKEKPQALFRADLMNHETSPPEPKAETETSSDHAPATFSSSLNHRRPCTGTIPTETWDYPPPPRSNRKRGRQYNWTCLVDE